MTGIDYGPFVKIHQEQYVVRTLPEILELKEHELISGSVACGYFSLQTRRFVMIHLQRDRPGKPLTCGGIDLSVNPGLIDVTDWITRWESMDVEMLPLELITLPSTSQAFALKNYLTWRMEGLL